MPSMVPFAQYRENAGAKKLVHIALAYAIHNPDADWPLDKVFDDPEEAAKQIGANSEVRLTPEEVARLKQLGKDGFRDLFERGGGPKVVQALVGCIDRLDMPEASPEQ